MSCNSSPPASPPAGRFGNCHLSAICLAIALAIVSARPAFAANTLLWFSDGRPTPTARKATDLLASAAEDGLNANDYGADLLRNAIENAANGPSPDNDALIQLDRALTSATRRYLSDLHSGRIDPQQLEENYSRVSWSGFDPDALLISAIADDRLPEAARSAQPPLAQYRELREVLARYRVLTGNPAWQKALPPPADGKLQPGQTYPGIAVLSQRLKVLGDLPANGVPPARYEGRLVDGVKSFQERHALTPDGVVGKGTLEQLNVTPEARVRQLELALERLRWRPLLESSRSIEVNIPEFRLRAYELRDGKIEMRASMNIIVGNANKTRTPIFDAEMRFVEFSPYWNVPPSIARGETLPKLRREPGYFDQQGFEFVGRDGKTVSGFSEASLDAVQRGEMRIRQRPGARNALGDIKFVFPNSDNIYLHHTPTPQLFKRDRRDFSHGCIRVEEPVALAKFVLADEPEWTEERIVQAMTKGRSATLRLREPFPVVIAYTTAVVRDGRIHFFPDIYGQDKILDEALRQRSQSPSASNQMEIGAKSNY